MSEENILRVEGVRAKETGKEENRSQLGPTATHGGLRTIHRNQVQLARFPAQYPRDQKLLMLWDETSKSSPVDSISMNKNRVHRTRFLCTKTKFNELDFWAYMDTLSTSTADKIGNSSTIYSIYNLEIESSGLELLETKYV